MSGLRDTGPEIERQLFHAFPSATTRQEDGWTVMPSSTDDAAKAVAIANLCGCPVLVAARGGDEPAGPPRSSLLRLSLERMTGVLGVTEPAMTAEVQAGIAMRNLEIVLNDHGLTTGAVLLPDVDPTLIDFVTNDSFSEASILYGRTDQIYLGAEGVLPSGEVFRIKPAPVRAAGPDVLGFLVAGHGRVSIVTALILRLGRLPKSRRVVPAGFRSDRLEDALTSASSAARVPIRFAAGRIYAPGWSDHGEEGGAPCDHVAVFVIEGEQAVVEATAVHLEGIVQACGGTLLSPQHALATRFVRAPRVAGGEATASISATAPWPSVLQIHRDVAGRLGDALLASRFSDFFHEGCRITWMLREGDLGRERLTQVVETLRGLGGRLTSRHPALEGDLPPHLLDEGARRPRMVDMKRTMDPGGIRIVRAHV